MLHALSAISVLLLSVSGFAKPVPRAATNVHLPISRKVNAVDITHYNAVQIDQDRARFLKNQVLHPAAAPAPNAVLSAPIKNALVCFVSQLPLMQRTDECRSGHRSITLLVSESGALQPNVSFIHSCGDIPGLNCL
jgi:hypothetical protein